MSDKPAATPAAAPAKPVISEEAIQKEISDLVANAKEALKEYMTMDQEQIDKITSAMALAGLTAQVSLAQMAIEETKRGIFEDKVTRTSSRRSASTTRSSTCARWV